MVLRNAREEVMVGEAKSEMDKLEEYLTEHRILFKRDTRKDTYFDWDQIIVFGEHGFRDWDAICHFGSYGYEMGLLEIMGSLVNVKEDGDAVAGYLTAQNVIERIEKKGESEMAHKIECIVKRPDEPYGHKTAVSDSLENLQNIVGGYIECVYLGEDLVIVCNEEGKLQGLEPNVLVNGDMLVGTIIVVGNDGDSFGDIPITFSEWKSMIDVAGGPFKW